MDGSQERRCIFRVSCSYATPLLQVQERVFHQVSGFIKLFVVIALLFTAAFRGNDRCHSLLLGLYKNRIRVVAFVSQKILCCEALNQICCLSTICCCTLCNNSPERHTMRIHGQMQFCVEPPFVRLMS